MREPLCSVSQKYEEQGLSRYETLLFSRNNSGLLRRHAEDAAGLCILDHPQRAVGSDLDIAEPVPDIPSLGSLSAPLAVEGDAKERRRCQAADQAGTLPLWKHRAVIEHEVAWRNDRHPVDNGLGQVRPRIRTGDRHSVIVLSVGD